jgi:Mlc titration factor MtfA (ptsG expression regulator)
VIHEFAHKVDMADGAVDGTPAIRDREGSREFNEISNRVLTHLRSGQGVGSIRSYAATNRSELFAVATEAFFLDAHALRREFADLYRSLASFYRQDPAGPAEDWNRG